tara:strand:+ start:3247 stop:3507 length:261 start_codon:yes stop_codon:yes gene_type:complete
MKDPASFGRCIEETLPSYREVVRHSIIIHHIIANKKMAATFLDKETPISILPILVIRWAILIVGGRVIIIGWRVIVVGDGIVVVRR